MRYKELKRLTELVEEYHWYEDCGLVVFIDYNDCKEVFKVIFNVDTEDYPDCKACDTCICIQHFDDFLECYTTENIEDIFPKEED